jgi:hypothetical protein
MAGKRRYSDEFRANTLAALAAYGGNVNRTAKELGIPEATIRSWESGKVHPEAAKDCERKKGLLADQLEAFARRILGLIDDAHIKAAPLLDCMIAVGIAVDKMLLLRSQPSAVAGPTSSREENIARIPELLCKYVEPADGTGNGTQNGTENGATKLP